MGRYNHRINARTDKNQKAIVAALGLLPEISVEANHDDLLVGYEGFNFWFEVKNPNRAQSKKTGLPYESRLEPGQKELRENWKGHWKVVFSLKEILEAIEYQPKDFK